MWWTRLLAKKKNKDRSASELGEGWILDDIPIIGTKKKFRDYMLRLGFSTDQVDKFINKSLENQKVSIEDKVIDGFLHQDNKYNMGE